MNNPGPGNDSELIRFFGVVRRPRTWLGVLFHWLAFPLGLFYFVFLVVGLSIGIGLIVVWVGIPVLLVVAGAWWLFGSFERLQARHLLGANVPPAPREWERVDGVWAKLKAHFGSSSTWKDLVYLLAKLPFGIVSSSLLIIGAGITSWFLAMSIFAIWDIPAVNGTWVPPLWFGIVSVPIGILVFFVALHVLNAWGWVCVRWAEWMFRGPATARAPQATPPRYAPPSPPPSPAAYGYGAPAASPTPPMSPVSLAPPAVPDAALQAAQVAAQQPGQAVTPPDAPADLEDDASAS